DVADHTDHASAVPETVEHVEHLLEAALVEAPETLVDEQRPELAPAGLLPDGIGESQRKSEGGGEGLATGERAGAAVLTGPQVADQQPEAPAPTARRGGVVVGELVATVGHRLQPFVRQLDDPLESGGEHEGR